tara:strand:- start:1610 stop:2359 length:750 start_codon:yes stop_codon:yes gene_type:complete
MKLLSIDTNAKTSKNTKYGYLTGIQYLSPYNTSGVNLCPMAEKAGCIKSCLYYSGRGKFKNVQQARLNRTKLYLTNQPEYFNQLITEIQALIKKAAKKELRPLIRLNGTSDIRWENIGFVFEDNYYRNIFEFFPNVQFMDYTKIPNRVDSKNGLNNWPSNYDLTFSYSGAPEFQKYNQRAIDKGVRIAVVFDKVETIPLQFHGRKVLGGDDNDLTFTKPKGSILALYAKGAKAEIQAGIDTQFILTKGA